MTRPRNDPPFRMAAEPADPATARYTSAQHALDGDRFYPVHDLLVDWMRRRIALVDEYCRNYQVIRDRLPIAGDVAAGLGWAEASVLFYWNPTVRHWLLEGGPEPAWRRGPAPEYPPIPEPRRLVLRYHGKDVL